MVSTGSRLRQALERRPTSVRAFQKAMDELGVRGSSYPMIHRYLAGKSQPSVEFLKASADLLSVREAWLLSGSGSMTEAEQAQEEEEGRIRRHILEGEEGGLDVWDSLVRAIPAVREELDVAVQMALAGAWKRRFRYCVQRGQPFPGMDETKLEVEVLGDLTLRLEDPFKGLGTPIRSSEAFTDYALALLQAMNLALQVPLMPIPPPKLSDGK